MLNYSSSTRGYFWTDELLGAAFFVQSHVELQ